MYVHLTIACGMQLSPNQQMTQKEFDFECNDFNEFKAKFLKRFGNVHGTNQADKDKPLVKKCTYSASDFDTFLRNVNQTEWTIKVIIN